MAQNYISNKMIEDLTGLIQQKLRKTKPYSQFSWAWTSRDNTKQFSERVFGYIWLPGGVEPREKINPMSTYLNIILNATSKGIEVIVIGQIPMLNREVNKSKKFKIMNVALDVNYGKALDFKNRTEEEREQIVKEIEIMLNKYTEDIFKFIKNPINEIIK